MAYRKIQYKGDPIVTEFVAAGTILTGMLVKVGTGGTITAHGTAGGDAEKLFALTPTVPVNGAADIDKSYASGELVPVGAFHSGQEVIVRLVNGGTVVIGQALESSGTGYVQLHVVDSTGIYYLNQVVGYACEAKDMSGSSGVDPSPLFRMRVA